MYLKFERVLKIVFLKMIINWYDFYFYCFDVIRYIWIRKFVREIGVIGVYNRYFYKSIYLKGNRSYVFG